jgi:hypothetical protein
MMEALLAYLFCYQTFILTMESQLGECGPNPVIDMAIDYAMQEYVIKKIKNISIANIVNDKFEFLRIVPEGLDSLHRGCDTSATGSTKDSVIDAMFCIAADSIKLTGYVKANVPVIGWVHVGSMSITVSGLRVRIHINVRMRSGQSPTLKRFSVEQLQAINVDSRDIKQAFNWVVNCILKSGIKNTIRQRIEESLKHAVEEKLQSINL